ncbi:MAG TPA: hypothetical protein IAA98_08165 [Candidatus Avipropionibacterium avicola]|uniref:DUF559 domain-containing protein n=1 Tax=Candidatus Avipropionibacterium avicola TaxID=2840701 RepID=A0A9D1KLR9_9ACTN|nr:hypothetical protein [Candidatus Avipropionibacterium avicola]
MLCEFDGFVKYGRLLRPGQELGAVLAAEKHREARLRSLGFFVIRLTWSDLSHPARLAATITRALNFTPHRSA